MTTDAELVRLAKAGDLPAFEELVTRHERRGVFATRSPRRPNPIGISVV